LAVEDGVVGRGTNCADAGSGNLGEGCPRPSAYVYLRQQVSERTRVVSDGLCGCAGRAAISPDLRFEVKELGEIEMVFMALVAAIDTELLDRRTSAPSPGYCSRTCSADRR
jgi:hypothetical protein